MTSALGASGIRHIRDGSPGYSFPDALTLLAQNGVNHSIAFPIATTASEITSTIERFQPYVDFVEPANEYDEDASSDPNWAADIRNEQMLLYQAVRSNPDFASIQVLGPSFGHPADASAVGPFDAYEDAGNEHDYTCNDNPATTNEDGISYTTNLLRASTTYKPIWTTEVGYADNKTAWNCAISDNIIAKYDPRTVADRWLAGMPKTYFYQFADMAPGENYNSMGLVTHSGNPKAQYTALQSMANLLSDRGLPFAPTPVAYLLSGNTSNVNQLLLQKRDGSYYLLLWIEQPCWNSQTGLPITVPSQTVAVTFPVAPASFALTTYTKKWSLTESAMPASQTESFPVTDAITFVHFSMTSASI